MKSIAPSRRAVGAICAVVLYALVSRVALRSLPEDAALLKWAVVLPPVLIDLALCWLFGRTLRRGAEPLITSFARHARGGDLPPELRGYTRRVTLAWTLLFAAMAAVAAWLAVSGPLRAWSLFVYVGSPTLVAALFLGEFAWRRVRFRRHPPARLADMLKYLRLPATRAQARPPLLALLRLHAMDDAVARRRGQPIPAAALLADAAALAAVLPPGRHVLNLCRDRYHFLVGYAAALIARRLSLLPPGSGDAAIRDICRDFGELCCVADHDEVPAGVTVLPPVGHPPAAPPARPAFPADQPAAVVFTSGSTGRPSPHVKSWGSLVRGALALGRHLGLEPSLAPQIIGTVPPQHMFGLEATVMLPLQWRGAVEAGRPLLPSDVKAALEAAPAPRWLMTTPLQLRACVGDALELRGALRGVISSTMPLEAPLAQAAEALWDCPVEEIYGSSETGMMALRRTANGPSWTLCEGLTITSTGGAAQVRGGHLDAPFTLTDRVELEGGRNFRLLGRIGDMVKVAGKRTSLEDLNARLRAVPGIADGVFYMPDGADRPLAFVVAPQASKASILEALRRDLDPVFLPRPLYLVDALPRAANGKITREGLEALLRRVAAR